MADNSQVQEDSPLPRRTPKHPHTHARNEAEDRLAVLSGHLLDRADTFIYSIVGILFLVSALVGLGYSTWVFVVNMQSALSTAAIANIGPAISTFVSDLLLVLIIVEVLSTVIHYLKSHTTSLRPFLFIGIISTTRIILLIGAKLSFGELKGVDFTNAVIELGTSAAVILALGITLKLLGRMVDIGE
jgi:uncharacterized membrane protein (DUF373 family)